ncbi:poly(ADP-ribose) glycohydrolase 1-like [Nicotiana tomentosiformis]|uniref:poly(ADP-ribose) glycohydrolase n=1 Tax=Nicotiana tabacum TaxID=4097 RepID=A0A1S4A8V7_TOBAC|nr:poly(ADP-ribose) glycohydrolase 1-like [Nicotiana tomentosiformis]XP_016473009.1 PREDICTED: poly(ADP-ribose) glycohydrolase 1-like [Nicotiana tabacum]
MENREDLTSILPFLPLCLRSSSLFWPPPVVEALKALSQGPHYSNVNSGQVLSLAISDIRNSLSLPEFSISSSASDGFALFFDDLIPRAEAAKWFEQVVPKLAYLLLRLPSLLESHYEKADGGIVKGVNTGLRLLESQQSGIVFLTQELVGALLACSFFCLFPTSERGAKHLPTINFDHLFAYLYDHYDEKLENKLKCIVHYFERIASSMPGGYMSFERKVLALEHGTFCFPYPKENFWSQSNISLCPFKISNSGFIEDQPNEAIEVDFANKYLGGGALSRGCVQEEIRFMINPELIAGMLFLPCMADNEAIEIVGTERFSNYAGYASSFRFGGDHVDIKEIDVLGRRKRRIIAIDALSSPGKRQYRIECLLREINKALCGFLDHFKCHQYQKLFQDAGFLGRQHDLSDEESGGHSEVYHLYLGNPSTSSQTIEETLASQLLKNHEAHYCQPSDYQQEIGVVTGNWGCGAFGGDSQVKAMLQWLAASQAFRPFILYYTFDLEALQMLGQVAQWISSQGWTVGELWNMLVEYSVQRLRGESGAGFFSWLLPSLKSHDTILLDNSHNV